MLELADVVTTYGSIEALKGITLSVPEGGIVSLIGANGAGKSTTLMTVSGVHEPVSGEIRFRGSGSRVSSRTISPRAGSPTFRKGVGFSPDSPFARTWRWALFCGRHHPTTGNGCSRSSPC